MPSGVVPTIGDAFSYGASLSAMHSGVVPHYRSGFSCGASLSALHVGVVPHYKLFLLAWYLTIGHAYW